MKFFSRKLHAIIQVVVSSALIIIGATFPLYVFIEYGLAVHPIYDRNTQSFVEYNYFLYSLAMGGIFIVVGTFCLILAVRYLRKLSSGHGNT